MRRIDSDMYISCNRLRDNIHNITCAIVCNTLCNRAAIDGTPAGNRSAIERRPTKAGFVKRIPPYYLSSACYLIDRELLSNHLLLDDAFAMPSTKSRRRFEHCMIFIRCHNDLEVGENFQDEL